MPGLAAHSWSSAAEHSSTGDMSWVVSGRVPGGASVYNWQLWKDPSPWAGLWQASSCPMGPMFWTRTVLSWLLRRKKKYPPETPNHGRVGGGWEGHYLEGAQLSSTRHLQKEDVKNLP